jgi:hypothetical protein
MTRDKNQLLLPNTKYQEIPPQNPGLSLEFVSCIYSLVQIGSLELPVGDGTKISGWDVVSKINQRWGRRDMSAGLRRHLRWHLWELCLGTSHKLWPSKYLIYLILIYYLYDYDTCWISIEMKLNWQLWLSNSVQCCRVHPFYQSAVPRFQAGNHQYQAGDTQS